VVCSRAVETLAAAADVMVAVPAADVIMAVYSSC